MTAGVSVAEYRAMVAASMSEAVLQAQVEAVARELGWLVYHTHDSRRSAAGFPDLCMVRRGRLIFAELKTQRGRTSTAQGEWLVALADVWTASDPGQRERLEVYVWRPLDMVDGTITTVLA